MVRGHEQALAAVLRKDMFGHPDVALALGLAAAQRLGFRPGLFDFGGVNGGGSFGVTCLVICKGLT